MINQSNESQVEKEILEEGQSITENLSGNLEDKAISVGIKNKLLELARTTGAEMNLFNPAGDL